MVDLRILAPRNNTAINPAVLAGSARFAQVWTAFCYALALILLGVVLWKVLIITAIILVAYIPRAQRTFISYVGLALLFLGLGVWTELVPPVSTWR